GLMARFRGLTATASLKHGRDVRARGSSAGFRGLTATASLKLASLPMVTPSTEKGFRGLTATASLKQHVDEGVPSVDARFRGLTATASLKHLAPVIERNPGLLDSVASQPRPH